MKYLIAFLVFVVLFGEVALVGQGIPATTFSVPLNANLSDSGAHLFDIVGRTQQLYSSTVMPLPSFGVNKLIFRQNTGTASGGGAFAVVRITASVTQLPIGSLSSNLSQNVGSNPTIIFNGTLALPPNSGLISTPYGINWIYEVPLLTTFIFNGGGNLLLDFEVFSVTGAIQSNTQQTIPPPLLSQPPEAQCVSSGSAGTYPFLTLFQLGTLPFGPYPCTTGTVNTAHGPPVNVLFVNGSPGNTSRIVNVAMNAPITITLSPPPFGPLPAPAVMWAWVGAPTSPTTLTAFGQSLGCMANPPSFMPTLSPQPFTDVPTYAPGLDYNPVGISFPVAITLQGLMIDFGAGNPTWMSITNAVIVNVQ